MLSLILFSFLLVQTVRICETLNAPVDGKIVGNCYNTYGSVCEFQCDEGHELTGSSTRTCVIDESDVAVWSGTVVTCPGMTDDKGHMYKRDQYQKVKGGILNYLVPRIQKLPLNWRTSKNSGLPT